jgi:hypothetical protein
VEATAAVLCSYEEESLNRSQMDIKRKASSVRTWKKRLFLDMTSTNVDTLVPSLYQCVETLSTEISTSSSSGKRLPRFSIQL